MIPMGPSRKLTHTSEQMATRAINSTLYTTFNSFVQIQKKFSQMFLIPQIYDAQCFFYIAQIVSLDLTNEPVHEISNNMVCATNKALDQPAHTRCLIRAFASRLRSL